MFLHILKGPILLRLKHQAFSYVINQSIPSVPSTAIVTSGIAEHRLMCTTENPRFPLLCLPVEILEDIILRLPAPAILRLRVVRRFLHQTSISASISNPRTH